MKTIFITGVAGLLGSNLAKYYLRKGYKVKGCDNFSGGYKSNIPIKNIDFEELDILDLKSLSTHMKDSDIVLHCAALAYEGLSVFCPKAITENIYSGTVSVGTAAIINKVEILLNCSSMARYGDIGAPFIEIQECKPEDPYGLAKYQAEQILNLLSDIHGLKVLHIVPHNIIGEGQRYDDPYRNVVSIMINRLLHNKSIIIYGDGMQKRSFSYIGDCVNAIYKLVESDKFKTKEVFNIGPDRNEITIKELAYKVGHFCQLYPQIEYVPNRPREVKNAWCSSEKARKKLDYNPETKVDIMVSKMVDWIKGSKPLDFDYHQELEIIDKNTPKTWTDRLI